MSPLSLRRYRADRLLRRDFYELRPTVLRGVRRRLAARGLSAESVDLEACYAQAWQGLYATIVAGEEVQSPSGWLVVVAFRRAIEDIRSPRFAPAVALREDVAGATDPDLAGHLDDLARLRQVFEALRGRLTERECEAASLCYLQGFSRAEAARRMGISERRMRRLMEGSGDRSGVAAKVGHLVGVVARGGWCEEQASLMRGLAFGVLDPAGERHRLALAHQRDCPACRAYVISLRGLAVALPPVGIPLGAAAAGVVGAAGVGAGGAAGGGWLLAGGPLGAKLAAGCLIALGVGAGCVALTVPGHGPVAHAAAAPRARVPRTAGEASAGRPVAVAIRRAATVAASRAAPSARAATASAGRHAARREFGLERITGGGSGSAPPVTAVARVTRASAPAPAPTPAATAPEPRARREFGIGQP